jgi:hypothetical protein
MNENWQLNLICVVNDSFSGFTVIAQQNHP